MNTTSQTLLERLRDPKDAIAWTQFVELYTPLAFYWANRLPLNGAAPGDLVQDLFVRLVEILPTFQYDSAKRSFRGWLKQVFINCWRAWTDKRGNWLVQAGDEKFADLEATDVWKQFWEQDYEALLVAQAFTILEAEFDSVSQTIFKEVMMNDRNVNEIATELGLTPNAVSLRKRRVLERLRKELVGFLD